jgi:sugar phosphate permease
VSWTSRRAVLAHVALAVWVPGCILACWWQVNIALSGDDIGWVYSVMWPSFAVFGVIFWWYLVHDDPESVGSKGLRRIREAAESSVDSDDPAAVADRMIELAEEEDPELAQYNAYLAELARSGRSRSWTRP